MLTLERLKSLLQYNPETGDFTWLVNKHRAKAGDKAGSLMATGYILIRVDQTRQLAHRLAWYYTHGVWPDADVDHINGLPHDNRIENLRCATRAENLKNTKTNARSSTGMKGVSWCSSSKKFRSTIRFGGRRVHLGLFNSAEEADAAYKAAAEEHHGEFASHLSRK